MSKVIMSNGGFYSCLIEPRGVSARWKETAQTLAWVAWRFKQFERGRTRRRSRENESCLSSFLSLPGFSRLCRSSSRLPRFPSALKLLKNRQATQVTQTRVFVLSRSLLLNHLKPHSRKNQTLSTHNANRNCRVRFYTYARQPLTKQLYYFRAIRYSCETSWTTEINSVVTVPRKSSVCEISHQAMTNHSAKKKVS